MSGRPSIEQQEFKKISQLHQRDAEASKSGDFETLRSLMSEDAVLMPPGETWVRGSGALDQHYAPMAETMQDVGVGLRHELLTFQIPCESLVFCGPEKRVYSVGFRAFGLVRDGVSTRFGMKLGVFAGYIPYVQHPVVSLSLTAGGF